ncbi:hypothetical protein [Dethiosulfatibacter aminovorans]|nr:hypothetical protein [Dethiosulfatibacter aminovorans]
MLKKKFNDISHYSEMMDGKRVFVYIGESGSGKSELAINAAMSFVELTGKEVHFFDMDQTKPLFRSREVKELMMEKGIKFHCMEQFQETPIVPHAVNEMIMNKDNIVVLDVGGNSTGAISLGQFSHILNMDNVKTFFVINYFRPFSRDKNSIIATIDQIKNASKIRKVELICNPNVGKSTIFEFFKEGYEKTDSMLYEMGCEMDYLAVPEWLYKEAEKIAPGKKVLKIKQFIEYAWI